MEEKARNYKVVITLEILHRKMCEDLIGPFVLFIARCNNMIMKTGCRTLLHLLTLIKVAESIFVLILFLFKV